MLNFLADVYLPGSTAPALPMFFRPCFSSVLLIIGSLYQSIYNITQPELGQEKVAENVQRHKLYLLCAFVLKATMEMLVSYSREQATKSRELNLLDIISFVNRCEAVLGNCQLTQECRMSPDGAILDQVAGGSVQLNTFQKIEPNLFSVPNWKVIEER